MYRELIRAVAKESGVSQKQVFLVLEVLREVIMRNVLHGDVIKYKNFGVFHKKFKKGRKRLNCFGSGKYVSTKDRYIVKFRVSRKFRKFIN